MWVRRAVACARLAGVGSATRQAAPGPALLNATVVTRRWRAHNASAHATVENYIAQGVLRPNDIHAHHLGALAKLPPKDAIDSVEEFVKECNGLDASPSKRYETMDAIVQARLDAVSSRPWQWQDYNTISHTSVNVEKRFVTQGAPPSSEYVTMMDPTVEPESLVPAHFQKVSLTMVGFDYSLLDSYVELIQRASRACDIDVSGRIPLPTRIEKHTLLKSPHVHKKHRAQYETRSHRRLVQFHNMSGATASAFLDYVVRLCPPGVELRLAHTTVETPTEELAELLRVAPRPDVSAVSHEMKRVLTPEQLETLTDTLNDFAVQKCPWALTGMPQAVRGHVRLCSGLREFFGSEEVKAAFDTFVDSGSWPTDAFPPRKSNSSTTTETTSEE